jgi:acyl dehydratase
VPLNRALIGRVYPASDTLEVSRETIRRFADAIGDDNPAYRDRAAARALGYHDVLAPPTFLTTVQFRFAHEGPIVDPELGLDFSLVVHGEQRFVHYRPVIAGDVLEVSTAVTEIRDAGRNELLTYKISVSLGFGEMVCDIYSTMVSRGTAATAGVGA